MDENGASNRHRPAAVALAITMTIACASPWDAPAASAQANPSATPPARGHAPAAQPAPANAAAGRPAPANPAAANPAGGPPSRAVAARPAAAPSLDAHDRDEVARAIAAIGQQPRPNVRPLVARIRAGLPPTLLTRGVDVLAAVHDTQAAAALIELSTHRHTAIRVKAIAGLAASRSPRARRVIGARLDDPILEVRVAAARGLGTLGPGSEMPRLVAAARRGLPIAVDVVGEHARPPDVARLLREVRVDNLAAHASLLLALATRESLPVRTRLAVVAHLAGLHAPAANGLLQQIVDGTTESDEVRAAARAALDDGAAPGSSPAVTR